MNYIGSKYTLLPFIRKVIDDLVGERLSDIVFCDMFAGTGAVGRDVKTKVRKVIANDLEYYSYVINRNYIGNYVDIEGKEELVRVLNEIPGKHGFIYEQYCAGGGHGRQYFSDENGAKIDAVRQRIEQFRSSGEISDDLYFHLLCSLLESADKLANTTSVYGAFLKYLKTSAQRPFVLSSAEFALNSNEHEVYQCDANDLIRKISGDVLYLDPPYNSRQYGANYHMLNTIAEYKPFEPKGKTGLRDYVRSSYCSKRTVADSFESLIRDAEFQYILLSYNNEGLMSPEFIASVMSKYGHYDVFTQDYQRYRADKAENRNHLANKTTEYIHVLEKSH